MVTQQQIDRALKAGFNMNQINQEIAVPGSERAGKAGYTVAQINQGAAIPGSITSKDIVRPAPAPTKTGIETSTHNADGTLKNTGTGAFYGAGYDANGVKLNTGPTSTGGTMSTPTSVVPNGPNTGVTSTGVDNSPGIMTYDELRQDQKDYLDSNPAAKAQFDLVGTYGKQQQDKYLADSEKAVVEFKNVRDYNKSQADNQMQRKNIQDAAGERQLQTGMKNNSHNTFHSALSSAPSSIAGTAAEGRIRELATQFDEFVRMNSLEGDAFTKSVAENMRRLQNDLNDKIGKTLAEKLAAIDNGVKNGEIATPEQLDKIFRDNAAQIMKEVPALTNFAVQQLSELNSSFMNTQKELRDNKITLDAENKDRETANNKFSSDLSVNGFAVNALGNPMLDMNGQKIVMPKDAPFPPQFDEKTGQLLTFDIDENGKIFGVANKVKGFTPAVSEKKSNIIETKDGLYDLDARQWIAGPNGDKPNAPAPKPALTAIQVSSDGTSMWSDKSKHTFKKTADGNITVSAKTGTSGGQCGRFVNDYLGIPSFMKDPINVKTSVTNSQTATAGSVGVMNVIDKKTGKPTLYGHTFVVESVSANGDINVVDSNFGGNEKVQRHTIKAGSAAYKNITGFYNPNKGTASQQFSERQRNIMDSIDGEPTTDQRKALGEEGLDLGSIQEYRSEKRKSRDYSTSDQKYISDMNSKIEKNKTYVKANAAQAYINNVFVALDRESGVGDIAAINQFQKIIDEGAVTRDQDVKLMQSAESVLGKMVLLKDKLAKGVQLTAKQRQEMRVIAEQMLEVSRKSFTDDPIVQARQKELELKGINADDTIFGQFGEWNSGTSSQQNSPGGGNSSSDFSSI